LAVLMFVFKQIHFIEFGVCYFLLINQNNFALKIT